MSVESIFEAKNLYVKYKQTDKVVLQDISFSANKGEHVAILGSSGCGKTTFLKVATNLLDKKEVEIKGSFNFSNPEVKTKVVFQLPTLLPWRTVFKNISYGLEIAKVPKIEIKNRVQDILQLVDLVNYQHYYPHQLSIGMQQRVNFARALVCEPDILFLDEPFSALDLETKKNIQEEFLKILTAKKITTIFITHNVDEAFYMAKKILIFSTAPTQIKQILTNRQDLNLTEDLKASLEYDYQ